MSKTSLKISNFAPSSFMSGHLSTKKASTMGGCKLEIDRLHVLRFFFLLNRVFKICVVRWWCCLPQIGCRRLFADGVYFLPFQIISFGTIISVDDVDLLQFQFILLTTTNNAGGELCFLLLHIRMHNMILSEFASLKSWWNMFSHLI